jgi:hypothetical protein
MTSIPPIKMKHRPTIIGPGSQTGEWTLGQRLLRKKPADGKHLID